MVDVVLIEDDPELSDALSRALNKQGYPTTVATNGLDGVKTVVERAPGVVVLDLGLPDISGFEVLKMLRPVSSVPVIVASARHDDADIIRAFDLGADDYVTKPFSTAHLAARIRAVVRRSSVNVADELRVGELRIDRASHTASLRGEELTLSPKLFQLLAHLAERQGQVVSKKELCTEVWDLPYVETDKTVDVHVSWLRKALGETADSNGYVRTVRGVGLKLVDPR
ncbi:MAG: response regulator transcription factor [Actinobacteria bacterium]|nr:response regulator transcription factor [Actinomycetota bacterium]